MTPPSALPGRPLATALRRVGHLETNGARTRNLRSNKRSTPPPIFRNGYLSGMAGKPWPDWKQDCGRGGASWTPGAETAGSRRFWRRRHRTPKSWALIRLISPPRPRIRPVYSNASFRNANLRLSLTSLGVFDFIYCQEVLHHTGDAQESFNNLVGILAPQGEIAIYVYRRKAPAREFMDDIVREKISALPYEEAMTVCRQITELGRRLAMISQEIECEDIPAIGIERGNYTPQRILYNFFLKCYWNPDLSFEENAVVNYDWYHPTQCSRHTLEEVEGWFGQAGLQIIWQRQDLYGITMRGLRKSA